jgi:IgA peptidase M64
MPLAEPFPVSAAPRTKVEYADADGAFASASVAPALSFSAAVPDGAAALEISADGMPVREIPVDALSAPAAALPPPSLHRAGNPAARFVVPVFAERFADEQRFLGFVVQLHSWILAEPPFNEPAIGNTLAFDAHYWPSDPVHGLFDTGDERNDHGRLFYGDRQLARRLLAPWTGNGVSLILIDSTLRGGAGGQPGWSAWTSISAKPGERWEAVCLHEVGHGLGLADEYLDTERDDDWPVHLEPNVSRDPRPSRAPWAELATVGDAPAPTGGLDAAASSAVGTFQGARYRRDLYRPAQDCLMRHTSKPFCAVCKAAIRAQLGG